MRISFFLRSSAVFVVFACACQAAARADAPAADAKPAAKPAADDKLDSDQQKLADKYAKLEKTFSRLAELVAQTDPKQAALLRQAFAESRSRLIDDQLDTLVKQLSKDELYSASKGEVQVQQDLSRLLELLQSGDSVKKQQSERQLIQNLLGRLDKMIKQQEGIHGQTEGEGDIKDLQDQQRKEAERAKELGNDIRQVEPKNESDDAKSQSDNGKNTDKPDGKSPDNKNPDGKNEPSKKSDSGNKGGKSPDQLKNQSGKGGDKSGDTNGDKSGKNSDNKSDDKSSGSGKSNGEKNSGNKNSNSNGEKNSDKSDKNNPSQPSGKPGQPSGKPNQPGSKSGQPGGQGKGQGQGKSQGQAPGKGQGSGQGKGDGKGQGQGQGQGEGGDQGGGSGSPSSNPPGEQASPARQRVQDAEDRMWKALQHLEQAKRKDAAEEQTKAIEALKVAKAELEKILRQMREEEVERVLAQLEARFRHMLTMQIEVYEGTIRLDKVPVADRAHDEEVESGRLSRSQSAIVVEADRALNLLHEEGSAVAFPEAVDEMRDDMQQVADRLGQMKVESMTQGIEQDIISQLQETIAALQKAQKEHKARKGRPGPGGQQEDGSLIDQLEELKMIRALQMRVNTRTKRYSRLLEGDAEQADRPDLIEALKQLAEREDRIHVVTHDIVVGKNH